MNELVKTGRAVCASSMAGWPSWCSPRGGIRALIVQSVVRCRCQKSTLVQSTVACNSSQQQGTINISSTVVLTTVTCDCGSAWHRQDNSADCQQQHIVSRFHPTSSNSFINVIFIKLPSFCQNQLKAWTAFLLYKRAGVKNPSVCH